ncbi:MAG: hypothetical protein GC146_02735 [Limimaricola sp.]|uniref:hypothetical protein n=1 Tax=Limimaricola sp. TaxID=2211665 RepID=UPI001D995C5A|nr:hypothetical protein [Limimaricola sp.]MBI1416116.1 hypothetical protein [Limimaricola sp.]
MGLSGPGIGHNGGPADDTGFSWRRHAWTQARAALLPTLPIEVVRLRVRRAAELGLPYRTYASVRAATGHDLIGFLFSSNALGLLRDEALPPERAARLGLLVAGRQAIVHRPLSPARVARNPQIDGAAPAPVFTDSWATMRDRIAATIRATGHPADRWLVIGETAFERDWAEAGRTAGFLPGAAYFAAS